MDNMFQNFFRMKGEIMSSTNLSDDSGWETVKKNKRKRNSNLPNKKRKADLQNVPTAEELNKLKEAEAKFQSNLFKMQVEELMKELKEKTPKMDKLTQWLQIFKDHLRNISEDSFESIEDYDFENGIEIPIIQNPKLTKGNFKFIPPTEIKEIGSFTLETMCSAVPVIDIAVEIPR
ncbi:nucleolar protein 6 [Caerostris extrusa]|uniref:Nucleolar protein 6 n=1 Tax=Caerostris extrusa TaxID=172846 RepID=A0AAV4P387_CAEEX|nr:nucleolar protein 6 [Caerostris extrusa]